MAVTEISDVRELARKLKSEGTLLVGVVGPAGPRGRDVELLETPFKAFLLALRRILGEPNCPIKGIVIVNNGTSVGIPGMVVRMASMLKFPILGISPRIAKENLLVREDLLTWVRIVGEGWGDEEGAIIECISALVVLGGQYGTLSLLTDVMNRNDHVVKDGSGLPIAVFPFSPLSGAGLVEQFVEKFLVPELGAEELSRLGIAPVIASPERLANELVSALTVRLNA